MYWHYEKRRTPKAAPGATRKSYGATWWGRQWLQALTNIDYSNRLHNRRARVLLLSLKAGGTGLNLTAASNVIHYDLWWNPAVEAQATDRAFRIGQQRNVQVHRFITQGTFEEKINAMLQSKKELANLAVAAGEKWVGDLSDGELRELVRLGG